jgi:lactoylglutathione lyase
MKKILVFIFGLAAILMINPGAQAQSPEFNHVAVYVVDLQKSTDFYKNVMQLERIDDPFKDGRHNWFKISEHGQLHVIGGATAITPHDVNIHLSFRVPSLPDFMKHLDQLQVKYGNFKGDSKQVQVRADGIHQVYFQDPDGYWIEVNDDKF